MYLNKIVILVYVNILCLFYVQCTFQVEELKWIKYEVDISVTPVKKEDATQSVTYITSKSGQEFQCLLPQILEEEISEKEVTNEKEVEVIDLLKSLKSSPCLSKSKDWWTYEFCVGRYIKQYHVEDGHILGQVITLGFYDSDYDWNNETDQEKFKNAKQKYHSQYYTNGSKCDLTGQPRTAEVRFYCEEDAGDYIYRVDEPGTCNYIIIVHTSRLCSHPQLKPLPSSKAHSISCHPVLDEKQYSKYLQKMKEQKARAEEKRSQWLSNQQERLQVMKKENDQVEAIFEKMKKATPEDYTPPTSPFKVHQFGDAKVEASDNMDQEELQRLVSIISKFQSDKLKEAVEKGKKIITLDDVSDSDENTVKETTKNNKDEDKKKPEVNEETTKATSSDKDAHPKSAVIDDDDKLRVHIRRLDRKSSDLSDKVHEMDIEQQKKLEQAVKEKLEIAGLHTGGQKIEVKIFTSGFYDNEEGKDFQSLSDEETYQFQNMIMALLTGQQEAVQEMKRQKKLEESYQFAWNDNENIDNIED